MTKYFLLLLLALPMTACATSDPVHSMEREETDSIEIQQRSNAQLFYDTSSIFKSDWQNTVTFSYPSANYSPKGTIQVIDSMHGYAFPVEEKTISGFGSRHSSYHKGIDILLHVGDNVVAAFEGKVRYAQWNSGGYGNLVIIRHANGLETYYAHLSNIKVKPNQIVRAGELIGLGGSTGLSKSPHLHFEVRYNHVAFDPQHIFDTENNCLVAETINLEDVIKRGKGTVASNATLTASNEDHDDHDHDHVETQERAHNNTASNGTFYSVKSGDSLSKIAQKYRTSVSRLCQLNRLKETSVLQIGQRLQVK